MQLDLGLFDGATRLNLPTSRATAAVMRTGPRGIESVQARIPLNAAAAYDLYTRLGTLAAEVTADGMTLARTRVEDLTLDNDGADIRALGGWRAMSDVLTTGVWSDTQYGSWVNDPTSYNIAFGPVDRSTRSVIKNSDQLFLAPQKNSTFATFDGIGVTWRLPDQSVRGVAGWQGTLNVLLPVNWICSVRAFDASRAFLGALATINGTGALISRSYHLTTPITTDRLVFFIFWNAAAAIYPNETGDFYAQMLGPRVVTSVINRINTTLTANRAAGASVTATVGSTTGMYAGMALVINSGNNPSEQVIVESVTSATQFVATFANGYVAGNAVQGFKVRPDEIVAIMPGVVTNMNLSMSSSTALIEPCDRDVLDAGWQDTTPADIVGELAARGSFTTAYETGIDVGGRLYFRPAGSQGQSWYVDAADLRIQQTLEQLINAVTARYTDTSGRTRRSAPQTNATSSARYGLVRRGIIDTDTSNAGLAAQLAAAATLETADPPPRATISITRLFTETGAVAPLWLAQRGDTITIRNLPPSVGSSLGRVQTFRVAETELDLVAGVLSVVPETPLPELAYLLAAVPQAAEVAASLSGTPAATPTTTLAAQQVRRRNPQ